MKIKINELLNSEEIISYCIPNNINEYKASFIGEPDISSELTIFFGTNTNDKRWYTSKVNRSILIKKLSKIKKKWIFVIDDKKFLNNKLNYYILVKSVNFFVEAITKMELTISSKKVIAITGSVGKTTLSRLLSLIMEDSQFIEVKRLTPLNLADFVFNRLKVTTKYIIAEVGLFYPGQVEQLANILSPYIGLLTNIYDMHIGWNGIKSQSELFSEKLYLLKNSQIKIVTKELFNKYAISNQLNKYNVIYNETDFKNSINDNNNLPRTNVSKNILELSEIVVKQCGFNNKIDINEILKVLEDNKNILRFHKYKTFESEIYVDSHSSIAGYFQAMSSHWYQSAILVILSLNFPKEENILGNILLIKKTFSYFNKVLISNNLSRYFGKTDSIIQYISEKNFMREILKERTVIIHDPKGIRLICKNKNIWG